MAATLLLLAPAIAQPADEAARELAATRAARERADAASRLSALSAAAAEARLAATRRTVASLDRALAQSDAALSMAQRRSAEARRASAASETALARARAPLADLVATLVRRERQSSALLLSASPDLAGTLRLRAALAALAPVLEARTAALRTVVARAAALRRAADDAVAQVAALRQDRDRRRAMLATAMAAEAHRRDLALADAQGLRQQADGLAEQAAALEAVVRRLGERDGAGARFAALPGPPLRPGTRALPASQRAYRMPAPGRLLAGMGEASATGLRTRGILLATVPGGIVRAPAAGIVAYAGAFRAWKAIVILDHGHGWTTLVAGLDAIVRPSGARVGQGDPIGRAGARLLVELRHHGRPVDIAAMAAASA